MFAETPERGPRSANRVWCPWRRFEEMENRQVWGEAGGFASEVCCGISVFGIFVFGCRNPGAKGEGLAVERGRRANCPPYSARGRALLSPSPG
jgi:hypothetical protein